MAGFISGKWPTAGLVLLGFEEAIPDLLLLIPVHLGAYVAQLVLGDIKQCLIGSGLPPLVVPLLKREQLRSPATLVQ